MHAKHRERSGQSLIVRRHQSAVAEAAQILGREEAETAHIGQQAGTTAILRCSDGLTGVFNDTNTPWLGDSVDRGHIGALSEQMHRNHRFGTWGDCAFDLMGIDIKRIRVNVDEHWLGAESRNGSRGRKKGNGTVITSSPDLTPSAINANNNASLPDAQPIPWRHPTYRAMAASNSATLGPKTKPCSSHTASITAITSALMARY